jgi:hypothetical protein
MVTAWSWTTSPRATRIHRWLPRSTAGAARCTRMQHVQIPSVTAAHLGVGSGKTAPNPAMARDNLLTIGGVMSRD